MLVHNYRSHSRLLELPSRLYYDNQLLASADPSLVSAPLWSELERPDRYTCLCCSQKLRPEALQPDALVSFIIYLFIYLFIFLFIYLFNYLIIYL